MINDNPSWRNENSLTRFPFQDMDPMLFSTGGSIPNDFIVDAIICTWRGTDWKLKNIQIYESYMEINFSSGTETLRATSAAAPYKNQILNVLDAEQVVSGKIVLGTGADMLATNPESYPYTVADDSGYLTANAIIPYELDGVYAFRLPTGELVSGNVVLEGGDGIAINISGDESSGTLSIDAVGKATDCSTGTELPEPIKSIVTDSGTAVPSASGKVVVQGGDVLKLSLAGASTIQVSDVTAGITL